MNPLHPPGVAAPMLAASERRWGGGGGGGDGSRTRLLLTGLTAAGATTMGAITLATCEEATGGDDGPQLCRAAVSGDTAQLTRLLARGADPNARHPGGWTALHAASIGGSTAVCELLLQAGAEPDALDMYAPRESCRSSRELMARVKARELEFSRLVDPMESTAGFTALHCEGPFQPAVPP